MIFDCLLMEGITQTGPIFRIARFHIVTYVYMLLGIVLKDRSKISVAEDVLTAFSFRV